ncbi:MAG TPA: lytic transglycosylase domain-containing protein [Rhodanobacter sp.]|nr:lytic transglycosylase domain-containing protein [Rhodanobacter sp.]
MSGTASHGGGVNRPSRGFPSRTILAWVVLAAVCLYLLPAHAGTLYQCTGASGEAVFSSSRAGYRDCRAIRVYAEPAARHRPPPAERSSLAGATARVTTSARSLRSDGANPTSLDSVSAGVDTSAQRVGALRQQRESLAAVQGSVETSARLPLAAAAAGTPGQWNYRESRDGVVASAPIETPASRVLRGAVYRVVRADGSVEYTNMRPASGKGRAVTMLFSYIATCVACNVNSTIRWNSVPLNLTAYADAIRSASIEYGVDEAFLRAIIHAESAFNPRALSLKGAQGLMQLMPATASDMGVLDAFNTAQNIRGGARYLSLLLHDFNGSERLAAAAYNAGPGAVQRYNGVPPYAETMVYVKRVDTLRKRYGAAIHPPLASRGAD